MKNLWDEIADPPLETQAPLREAGDSPVEIQAPLLEMQDSAAETQAWEYGR